MGNIGVIHGDPVLSNIIKKTNDDLVFLDPREVWVMNLLYTEIQIMTSLKSTKV